MTLAHVVIDFNLLLCNCPWKCHLPGTKGAFSLPSWSRFSPNSDMPSSCSNCASLTGKVLVTTIKWTSVGIVALTFDKFSASSPFRSIAKLHLLDDRLRHLCDMKRYFYLQVRN